MTEEKEQGKVCPRCGAAGKGYTGEHETAALPVKKGEQEFVDVGWRCWRCGFEWGFELLEPSDAR